jgi:hypothetical protein
MALRSVAHHLRNPLEKHSPPLVGLKILPPDHSPLGKPRTRRPGVPGKSLPIFPDNAIDYPIRPSCAALVSRAQSTDAQFDRGSARFIVEWIVTNPLCSKTRRTFGRPFPPGNLM